LLNNMGSGFCILGGTFLAVVNGSETTWSMIL
jgi:hypothetical protein